MPNPPNNNFFEDFLEDYFAECEEHLAVVRRELLALESFVNQSQIERSHLNQLFRCFHSLKGLSGMVGVGLAEELAHIMEGYLRVLRDQAIVLSPDGFEALIAGTKLLEQVIVCYRTQASPPDITSVVSQLTAVISNEKFQPQLVTQPTAPLVQLKPQEQAEIETAIANGQTLWHFIFSPNSQLSEQGIRVNTVREQLQTWAKLIYVAPRMSTDNKILFDFVLATPDPEIPSEITENPGLTYQPLITHQSEGRRQEAEGRRQEAEGRRQEAEGRRQEAEGRRQEAEEKQSSSAPSAPSASPALPAPPAPLASPAPPAPSSNLVRVELPKLDDLMRMVGELVMSRARLAENLKDLTDHLPSHRMRALQEVNQMLERQLRDLRQGVMQIRLVPIGETFARMQFVVRDLVRTSQKQVTLEIHGEETEIDKFVVERMLDPLLHLVRNAVSHGIESESERLQAGKSAQGKIALRATTSGEMVIIEIEDDGRGVDVEKVLERGHAKGLLLEPEESNEILHPFSDLGTQDDYDPLVLLSILCSPGFSTKEQADLTSGRGVGMSIVKNTVQELGGSLGLETSKGKGTRFTIQLPLTLAIADALIVTFGGQTFAIPQSFVQEIKEVTQTEITVFENNEIIPYRNTILPLMRLTQLLEGFTVTPHQSPVTPHNTVTSQQLINSSSASPAPPTSSAPSASLLHQKIVVVGFGGNLIGMVVEGIVGLREIVVRPLTDPLVQVMGIAGATELGDGCVVLILDVGVLIRLKKGRGIRN